jgi:hypothetical protein
LAKNAQRSKTVKVRRVLFASTKKEPELNRTFDKRCILSKVTAGKVAKLAIPTHPKETPKGRNVKSSRMSAELLLFWSVGHF